MRTLFILFNISPLIVFCQCIPTTLEVHMFNNERVVVNLDGKQFDTCSKFQLSGVSEGDHHLKVYQTKRYVNPYNKKTSERLIPVYSGGIYLAKNKKTTCTINKYHQKEIKLKL